MGAPRSAGGSRQTGRMTPRTALLVGATGLVGQHCLRRLLDDPLYRQVVVLARRQLDLQHPRLAVQTVDFEVVEEVELPAIDDVYCCLGTTIRAAGSRAAFYRVDHDYPVAVGRRARTAGARRYALVSSIGADPRASNYYLRMKGETERDVAGLGYECVELLRPSLLLGQREQRRMREQAAMVVARATAPLLVGRLRAYRPIQADAVAAAMVAALRQGEPGTRRRTFDAITRLAG